MITGDHLLIAVETAKALNLGDKVPGSDVVEPLIRTAEGLSCTPTCYIFPYLLSSKSLFQNIFWQLFSNFPTLTFCFLPVMDDPIIFLMILACSYWKIKCVTSCYLLLCDVILGKYCQMSIIVIDDRSVTVAR